MHQASVTNSLVVSFTVDNMESNKLSIPSCAEKFLFAENLVNYVMVHCCRASRFENLKYAEQFRNCVFNGFCYTVRTGLDSLYKLQKFVVLGDYVDWKDRSQINQQWFLDYAKDYREYYLEEGFVGDYFLKYCIRVALLAYHLYEDGMRDAPSIAVYAILCGFPADTALDMIWKSVYFAALSYSDIATVSVRNNPYIDRRKAEPDGSNLEICRQ